MSGRYLLDTNVIIALFAGETEVQEHLAGAEEAFLLSIAVGELFYGARKSAQVEENLARIREPIDSSVVLGCDAETARHYGEVKNNLRLKGQPLPENDIWIAALAFQHSLTLVTRDTHFGQIEALPTAKW